jgi:hypothetical protein
MSLVSVFDILFRYGRVGIPRLYLAEAWVLEGSRIKIGIGQSSAAQRFAVAS